MTLKNNLNTCLLILLLTLPSYLAHAQQQADSLKLTKDSTNLLSNADFVVTANGDTLRGSVSKPLIGKPKFRSDNSKEPVKITPEEFRDYYISKRNLLEESVIKPGKSHPEFMQVIENGKIKLYEIVYYNYSQYGSTTTTEWYVGNGPQNVWELKTSGLFFLGGKSKKERKDNFAELIKDNKVIYDQYIAEDKFTFKSIRNFIHLYNTGQPLTD